MNNKNISLVLLNESNDEVAEFQYTPESNFYIGTDGELKVIDNNVDNAILEEILIEDETSVDVLESNIKALKGKFNQLSKRI